MLLIQGAHFDNHATEQHGPNVGPLLCLTSVTVIDLSSEDTKTSEALLALRSLWSS